MIVQMSTCVYRIRINTQSRGSAIVDITLVAEVGLEYGGYTRQVFFQWGRERVVSKVRDLLGR